MKKIGTLFFLLLVSLLTNTVVFANDGSLRIDTSLDQNAEKFGIQYFEQEADLAKLFQPEMGKLIGELQEVSKKQYDDDKSSLFIKKIKTENIVDSYQPLLFVSQTMVKSDDSQSIMINQKKQVISWQMIAIFILGILFTGYALSNVKTKKWK